MVVYSLYGLVSNITLGRVARMQVRLLSKQLTRF